MDPNETFMKQYLLWYSSFFSIFQFCFMKSIGYITHYTEFMMCYWGGGVHSWKSTALDWSILQ